MAERTGQLITERRPPWHRRSCAGLFVFWLAIILTSTPLVDAAQPGAKSRQNVRHRSHSPHAGERTDREQKGRGGILGLRSMFGGPGAHRDPDRAARLLDEVPMTRLTEAAKQRIYSVTEKPTLYRRLPQQTIQCDPDLFLFLTRKPETIVGMWDLMGITQVQTKRLGPYEFDAVDGSGTSCRVDLLYGDHNLHVFHAVGSYDGKYAQKPVTGSGIFVLKSTYQQAEDGAVTVLGVLDCYVKFDSLGADLLARTLGGLIGKSADHNFVETAKFIGQVSKACKTNPTGMLEMADRLPQVDPATRLQFAKQITTVAIRYLDPDERAAALSPEIEATARPR